MRNGFIFAAWTKTPQYGLTYLHLGQLYLLKQDITPNPTAPEKARELLGDLGGGRQVQSSFQRIFRTLGLGIINPYDETTFFLLRDDEISCVLFPYPCPDAGIHRLFNLSGSVDATPQPRDTAVCG